MTFFLSKALWYLVAPGNLLVLALALGIVLVFMGRRKLGHGLIVGATFFMLVIGALPVADWVGAPLESRFPRPSPPARVTGIVVLGGYVDPWVSAARHTAALTGAAERLIETAILARRYPNAKILISGGTPIMLSHVFSQPPVSEGEITEKLLAGLGVRPDRILLETRSRNTYENGLFSEQRVHPKPGQTWLLVTSADAMPRAIGIFRRLGWDVVPWPVHYRTMGTAFPLEGFDVAGHLSDLDTFTHEWVGLVAYWLMGRTSALFPAPQG